MREVRQAFLPAKDILSRLPQGRQDCRAQVQGRGHGRDLHRNPHGGRAVLDAHPVRACDHQARRGSADHDADRDGPGQGEDRHEGEKRLPQDRHRWRERHHPLRHEVRAGGIDFFFFFRTVKIANIVLLSPHGIKVYKQNNKKN